VRSSDVSAALQLGRRNVATDEYHMRIGRFDLPFDLVRGEVRTDVLATVAGSGEGWRHLLAYHGARSRNRTVPHSIRFLVSAYVLSQRAAHQFEFQVLLIQMAYLNRHFPNGRVEIDRLMRQLSLL